MEVKLDLSVDEVNTVLRGLAQLSIAEAGSTHNKIFNETQKQLAEAQKKAEKDSAKK